MQPRPSLVPRTVDFSASWGEVASCVKEALENPLRPTSIHVMTLNQRVYFMANGPCTNLPADAQAIVTAMSTPSTSSAPQQAQGSARAQYPLLLHQLLQGVLAAHLEASVSSCFADLSGTTLLIAYSDLWHKFSLSLSTLTAIFSYLQNQWKAAAKPSDARQIGEAAWRDIIFKRVKDALVKACLTYLAHLREGVPGDPRLLRTVVESLARMSATTQKPLHLYQSYLEASYLPHAEAYFRTVAEPESPSEALVNRLCRVVTLLKHELKRVEQYLHQSTVKPLTRIIATAVLGPHASAFMAEFSDWVASYETKKVELAALYWLMARDDACLRGFGAALTQVVTTVGRRAIESADSPTLFVGAALNNFRRFRNLHETVFEKNAVLWKPILDGCAAFTNDNALCANTAIAADYVASFAHLAAKRGTNAAAKSDVDAIIDEHGEAPEIVVTMLNLLTDKDVFQARFADLLANRLISGKFVEETELQMIAAVSLATGRDFCYKWRRMLTDMESSATMRASFEESRVGTSSTCDFRPLVLTQGSWPLNLDQSSIIPPPVIEVACAAFSKWFDHDRKRVRWVHSVSYGTVLPVYIKARRYEWTVTMAQALVLNAFNGGASSADGAEVSLEDISRNANCALDVITRAAQSLVRLKALISPTPTAVALNLEYTSPVLKVQMHVAKEQQSASTARTTAKISASADATAAVAGSADVGRAMDDRKFAIQTAIVRVAKSRKTIAFADLMSEVINMLRTAHFTPSVQAVKVNIESLIEKEYLERRADDPSMLLYVA